MCPTEKDREIACQIYTLLKPIPPITDMAEIAERHDVQIVADIIASVGSMAREEGRVEGRVEGQKEELNVSN